MNRTTGSGIDRLMKCDAAGVLPRSGSESPWSAFGTVMHKFLADCATVGREAALANVPPEHFDACDGIDLEKLPASRPEAYAAEVGFSYDPDTNTAVELGRGMSHEDVVKASADLDPRFIVGVADVVGLTDDAVVIADYKSGWHDYGDLKGWWQGLFYALCACLVYKREKAVVLLIRVKEDGNSYFASIEIGPMELDGVAQGLLELADRVELNRMRVQAEEHVAPYEGSHCKWCPSFAYCGAKSNLATALAQPEAWSAGVIGPQLSISNAALVYERLVAAKAVIEHIESSLREFATDVAVPLPDGYVYGSKQHSETVIDPDAAIPVLTARFGDEVALATLETKQTLTQAAIKRALTPWAKANGHKMSPVFKQLMEELKETKASRVVTSNRVTRHKPKEPEPVEQTPEQQAEAEEWARQRAAEAEIQAENEAEQARLAGRA